MAALAAARARTVSRLVCAAAADWPPQVRLTGFLLSDHADAGELAVPVGERPIVFTPGSANRHAARFFTTAIAATARMGRRAVLVTSYRDHLPGSLPDHVEHVSW